MIAVARNTSALESIVAELGGGAVPLTCDITDERAVSAMVETVMQTVGDSPDIVVNNAGVFRVARLDAMPIEMFREVIETNLFAPFLVLRAFIAPMRARGSGHFVTLGSVADRSVFPENGAYSPAKFGVRAMHEILRDELRGSGVRATLVSPGPVDTSMWDGVSFGGETRVTPDRAEMLAANAVAGAVLFAVTQPTAVNIDELRLSHA